jgi:hypothetical protein
MLKGTNLAMKEKGFAKWQRFSHGAKMFCQELEV